MDFRYSRFDPLRKRLEDLLRTLESVFNHLILQTNGDVDAALEHLDRLGQRYGLLNDQFTIEDFKKYLEKKRSIEKVSGGTLKLTRRGEQVIRRSSLEAIFSSLRKDAAGDHRVSAPGVGNERLPETRPYQFGDPVSLIDPNVTLSNAIRRAGIDDISVSEEDLAVYETEPVSSCATVLMVDVSHSMILYGEDRITPAKRVALALTELITSKFKKDTIDVVLFGDEAVTVPLDRLPYISNGPYHTNTRAGLIAAQELLKRRKAANKQIFMITDGKPSCIHEDGHLYKNPFGLDRKVVAKTLDEAARCRRKNIPVTTFMLTADPYLRGFVEEFTEVNRGRAYFADSARLEGFVLVDYLRNRRRRMR